MYLLSDFVCDPKINIALVMKMTLNVAARNRLN